MDTSAAIGTYPSVGVYLRGMSKAQAGGGNDSCALTVAVGSTDLGETFCTIVAESSRHWPWPLGVNLRPGPSSTFAFEADGPLFGRGVQRLAWVELAVREEPSSLLWVMGPEPQQPDAKVQLCVDDFVLTVNEAWGEGETHECWLKLPEEVTVPGAPILRDERAELLVLTTVMGRAWMHVPVSSGRGKLRGEPSKRQWWPFGRSQP